MQLSRELDKGVGYKLGLVNREREGKENSKELQRACSLLPALLASVDKPAAENSSSVCYSQSTSSRELLQIIKKRSLPSLLQESSKRTALFLA